MRRRLLLVALAAAVPAPVLAATPNDALLAAPLDTSLAPPPPVVALPGAPGAGSGLLGGVIAGGEASTVFGSNGLHGGAVRLDSGLIAGTTRASVAFGSVQGPRRHDGPAFGGEGTTLDVETALPHGITMELGAGYAHDRWRFPGS